MPDWPHSPPHRLLGQGTYMFTAGTYLKKHIFNTPDKLNLIEGSLISTFAQTEFQLQAWAVMSNHYHFIVNSRGNNPEKLKKHISNIHRETSLDVNKIDSKPGRKVWFQFWDSKISYPKSYFARLKYVHNNPVHHKLVATADNYQWCSAAWFKLNAPSGFIRMIESFKIDNLNVEDDF